MLEDIYGHHQAGGRKERRERHIVEEGYRIVETGCHVIIDYCVIPSPKKEFGGFLNVDFEHCTAKNLFVSYSDLSKSNICF